MKFKLKKKNLENSFEIFNNVVDSSNFCKEYRGVLIQIFSQKIVLVGTNGDVSAKSEIEIEDFEPSSKDDTLLVPYLYLKNAIREMEGANINAERKGGFLVFSDDISEFKLNLMQLDTFPTIDFSVIGPEIKVAANEIRDLVKNTAFVSSPKIENTIFCSCNLILKPGEISLVATDSFRLATDSIEVENTQELDVVVLSKNLKNLVGFEYEGEVLFYPSRFKLSIVFENIVLQTKVLDIPYKDVTGVFPKNEELTRTIFINKDDLMNQLSKISVTLDDGNRKVRMWREGEYLNFMSSKDNVGNAVCKTTSFRSMGAPFSVSFDMKYFKDALSPFSGEIVIFLNEMLNRIVIVSKSRTTNRQIVSPQRNERNSPIGTI